MNIQSYNKNVVEGIFNLRLQGFRPQPTGEGGTSPTVVEQCWVESTKLQLHLHTYFWKGLVLLVLADSARIQASCSPCTCSYSGSYYSSLQQPQMAAAMLPSLLRHPTSSCKQRGTVRSIMWDTAFHRPQLENCCY